MYRVATDDRGSGIREGLATEMWKVSRTWTFNKCLNSTFIFHAMNLMMAIPCEKFFSDGGLLNKKYVNYYAHATGLKSLMKWVSLDNCGQKNNIPCGENFWELAHVQWEYVGTFNDQFLERKNGD